MQYSSIQEQDPEVYNLIQKENQRITEGLVMIPSENLVSNSVLEANGSIFTNKYAEGYPGKRYYEGNAVVDQLELLAQKRALNLFGADGYTVNVQPYSGSPANIEVYTGLLSFGDTILSMELSSGVHLTHGSPVNFSGKAYAFVYYDLDPVSEQIDYDLLEKLALEHKPKMILSGFTAYPRAVNFERVALIAKKVGAISLADISHVAGLVAAGLHQSPFPFTDVVTTTTHKTLRGPRGGMIFSKPEFSAAIDKAVFPGLQGGPHEHTIAALAVALKEAGLENFKVYAQTVVENARVLAETLSGLGLRLVSGGTDTHLLLVDLRSYGEARGYLVAKALDLVGIYANRNAIYKDTTSPFYPSGLRLGTAALTTRGMGREEMKAIGKLIAQVIAIAAPIALPEDKAERAQVIAQAVKGFESNTELSAIAEQVKKISKQFFVPGV